VACAARFETSRHGHAGVRSAQLYSYGETESESFRARFAAAQSQAMYRPSSTLSRACVRACARACAVRVPVRVPVRVFVRVRVSGMRSRGMRWRRGSNEGGGDEGGGGGLWQRRARLSTLGSIELARNRRTTFACNFNNITASQLVESRSERVAEHPWRCRR